MKIGIEKSPNFKGTSTYKIFWSTPPNFLLCSSCLFTNHLPTSPTLLFERSRAQNARGAKDNLPKILQNSPFETYLSMTKVTPATRKVLWALERKFFLVKPYYMQNLQFALWNFKCWESVFSLIDKNKMKW